MEQGQKPYLECMVPSYCCTPKKINVAEKRIEKWSRNEGKMTWKKKTRRRRCKKIKNKEPRQIKTEVLTFMRVVAVLSDTAAATAAVQ